MTSIPIAPWKPDLSGRPGPLYRAIATALHDDIRNGTLPPGTRLPTHRDLAWTLKVTVGTVTRAYQEAERQGLIGGEVGRGTFVRDPRRINEGAVETLPGGIIDLSVNATALWPDADSLRDAVQAVAGRGDLLSLMGYQPPQGPQRLRAAIAAWAEATSGLSVPEDQVLLTTGGQGAMHAALSATTRPGDVLLVEQVTYPGIKTLALQLGLRLVPVAMDGDGILPDALEQAARGHGAHALYCMPTLQNPTTATMPRARREAIAAVARRLGLVIVEDDVYGFLARTREPTLAELAPEVTIHIGSVSKSLFPGLRTGYVIAPRPLLDRLAAVTRATILTPAHLGAVVTAELIESGEALRIAERRRGLVAERQALARSILGNRLGGSDPAVTHLWLTLPESWRRDAFARALLEQGVKVTPADAFAAGKAEVPNAVRVCLCSVDRAETLEQGLRPLATLLDSPLSVEAALV